MGVYANCPSCGGTLSVSGSNANVNKTCPICKHLVKIVVKNGEVIHVGIVK